MKEIKLSRGYVALVDDDDYERMSQLAWHASGNGTCVYARHTVRDNGKYSSLWMHRLIINAPPYLQVDHIDGRGWNNQKSNLRLCTAKENNHNRRPLDGRTSGYIGVCLAGKGQRASQSWIAGIGLEDKSVKLGYFKTEELAATARDIAALWYFGDFAKLNFPERVDEYRQMGMDYIDSVKNKNTNHYRGVSWSGVRHLWLARIGYNKKYRHLGYFQVEAEAAAAYDRAALFIHGTNAFINFPELREKYISEGIGFAEIKKKTSPYIGVYWNKDVNWWAFSVVHGGKRLYVGKFNDEIAAAMARDKVALELFGQTARLNFPEKINEYLCGINKECEEGVLKS